MSNEIATTSKKWAASPLTKAELQVSSVNIESILLTKTLTELKKHKSSLQATERGLQKERTELNKKIVEQFDKEIEAAVKKRRDKTMKSFLGMDFGLTEKSLKISVNPANPVKDKTGAWAVGVTLHIAVKGAKEDYEYENDDELDNLGALGSVEFRMRLDLSDKYVKLTDERDLLDEKIGELDSQITSIARKISDRDGLRLACQAKFTESVLSHSEEGKQLLDALVVDEFTKQIIDGD